MVPFLGLVVLVSGEPTVIAHVDLVRALAVGLGVGMVFGAGWYLLNPRSLAERLTPMMLMLVAFVVLGAGGGVDDVSIGGSPFAGYGLLGMLAGLVLAETWRGRRTRQQDPALSSRESMRELH
jgi:hypothetical protein